MAVRGPYTHKSSGMWRLIIDGKARYFATREAADAEKVRLQSVGSVPPDKVAAESAIEAGSPRWWSRLLAVAASRVAAAPHDGDAARVLRAIAAGATSARQLQDMQEFEAIEEANARRMDELMTSRKHGTRIRTTEARETPARKTLKRDDAVH